MEYRRLSDQAKAVEFLPRLFASYGHSILENGTYRESISWIPSGDWFEIKDVDAFHTLCSQAFGHGSVKAFKTQMRRHGFKRPYLPDSRVPVKSPEHFVYSHPNFRTQRSDPLRNILGNPASKKNTFTDPPTSPSTDNIGITPLHSPTTPALESPLPTAPVNTFTLLPLPSSVPTPLSHTPHPEPPAQSLSHHGSVTLPHATPTLHSSTTPTSHGNTTNSGPPGPAFPPSPSCIIDSEKHVALLSHLDRKPAVLPRVLATSPPDNSIPSPAHGIIADDR
ncbi:hypothetical protein OH77DRAFT_199008 [Trametes cingulata]|nr:hypothetical protein OH77DRAFT_199008 [Trametes cingulata]